MSNVKISQLSGATTLTGSEELPVVQDGNTVRTSVQDILNVSPKPYKSFVCEVNRFPETYLNPSSTVFGLAGLLLKNRKYIVVVWDSNDDFSNLINIVNEKPFGPGCIFEVTGDTKYKDSFNEHYIPNVWGGTELYMLDGVNNKVLYNDFGYDLEWNKNYEVYNWGGDAMTLSFPVEVDQSKLEFLYTPNDIDSNWSYFKLNYFRREVESIVNNDTYFTNIDFNWSSKNEFNGAGGEVYELAIQNDGKILVGGYFNDIYDRSSNTILRSGIFRLNPDCSIDYTFMPESGGTTPIGFDLYQYMTAAKILPNGQILIGGSFDTINDGTNTNYRYGLARLNSDGTLDNSFLFENDGFTNFGGEMGSIEVTNEGKILVVGGYMYEYTYSGVPYPINGFIVLNEDGSPDQTFLNNVTGFTFSQWGDTEIHKIVLLEDGKILIGGYFDAYEDINGIHSVAGVIRLNSDYTLDDTYYNSGFTWNNSAGVFDIAVQSDGKILVGGEFVDFVDTGNTYNAAYLIRLNSNGTFDDSFYYNNGNGGGVTDYVRSIDLTDDGKISVGGNFTGFEIYTESQGSVTYDYGYFIVLNQDGLPYNEQYSGVDGEVFTVKNIANKKCLIGGSFYSDYNYGNNIFSAGNNIGRINLKNDVSAIVVWDNASYYPSYKIVTEVRLYE